MTTSVLTRLFNYLDKLTRTRFFGRITLSFQNGRLANIEIYQSKKLDDLN